MKDLPDRAARSYGVGWNLYVLVGMLAALFLGVAFASARKDGNWTPFYIFSGVLVAVLLMFQLIRFKVGPDGFVFRTPLSSDAIDFTDVTRGYFIVTYAGETPQGIGDFCVERKDGKQFPLNMRIYPITAAAALFEELDRHGIPIEVPNLWAANRMVNQIRRAQAKLRAKSGA